MVDVSRDGDVMLTGGVGSGTVGNPVLKRVGESSWQDHSNARGRLLPVLVVVFTKAGLRGSNQAMPAFPKASETVSCGAEHFYPRVGTIF